MICPHTFRDVYMEKQPNSYIVWRRDIITTTQCHCEPPLIIITIVSLMTVLWQVLLTWLNLEGLATMLNKELIEEYNYVNETSITIMYNYIYRLCIVILACKQGL